MPRKLRAVAVIVLLISSAILAVAQHIHRQFLPIRSGMI